MTQWLCVREASNPAAVTCLKFVKTLQNAHTCFSPVCDLDKLQNVDILLTIDFSSRPSLCASRLEETRR
jgi:hypothetical protein